MTDASRAADPSSPLETVVAVARSSRPDYGALDEPLAAPELPSGRIRTVAQATLRKLFESWGLDAEHAGSPSWNPLGTFIPAGSRVVVKPNWVLHRNKSGHGLECLLTHTTAIEAVLDYVALTRPGRLVLGDAPVQGCDFEALQRLCRVDEVVERFQRRGMDLHLCDFRRTALPGDRPGGRRAHNLRGLEHFVLFDLKEYSLLERLAADASNFRVTMYDPDVMSRAHAPGRHQYLIAREVIEADVVINLPKLKAHRKACVTGALKNLVGVNGHKDYLPHHRKGGSGAGGDCYPGRSWLKGQAEELLDAANRARARPVQATLARTAGVFLRCAQWFGADRNLEGSWHGNDTVWRMSLDVCRIVLYGRVDGTLARVPQRRLVTITDAIVAGEGEGPMAPTPVPAGFLTGASNPAAAEWVHARLMGYEPRKVPIVSEAFGDFPFRLASFPPSAIRVRLNGTERAAHEMLPFSGRAFRAPEGWRGHCELAGLR